MIIKTKLTRCFTIVPNSIYEDQRLSIEAKATLIHLLSRPPKWAVRHDQLRRHLQIGRKRLERALTELVDAGYAERDEVQGRDAHNRFTTLNYIVQNVPIATNEELAKAQSVAPTARRHKPLRETCSDSNKGIVRKDSNNLSPNPFPESTQPQFCEDQYSPYGQHALASGLVRSSKALNHSWSGCGLVVALTVCHQPTKR